MQYLGLTALVSSLLRNNLEMQTFKGWISATPCILPFIYPLNFVLFFSAERSMSGQCSGWWHHSSSGAGDATSDDTAPAEPLGRALSGKSTTPRPPVEC